MGYNPPLPLRSSGAVKLTLWLTGFLGGASYVPLRLVMRGMGIREHHERVMTGKETTTPRGGCRVVAPPSHAYHTESLLGDPHVTWTGATHTGPQLRGIVKGAV